MIKKWYVGALIACFTTSNLSMGWATETMPVSPIIVEPQQTQGLNQQVMDRDRQNRDKEIEIQQLIEQNNKLIQALGEKGETALARTMQGYTDAILSRDRARIEANSENRPGGARYGDLVNLTEDADAATESRAILDKKNDELAQKYQALSALENEMSQLNDRLQTQESDKLAQKQTIIDGYQKIAREQQDKIQDLVNRLGEMDKKIAGFDAMIAQKDRQIATLKSNLVLAQTEASNQGLKVNQLGLQLAQQQDQLDSLKLNLQHQLTQAQGEVSSQKGVIDDQQQQLARLKSLKAQDNTFSQQLAEKQNQIDLLKSELEKHLNQDQDQDPQVSPDANTKQLQHEIAVLKAQVQKLLLEQKALRVQIRPIASLAQSSNDETLLTSKDATIKQLQDEIVALKDQSQELASKQSTLNAQADQINTLTEPVKDQPVVADMRGQVVTLKNQIRRQDAELKAKDDSIQWLNQVLTAAKNKVKYDQLTNQERQVSTQQFQSQIEALKADFAHRFRHYDELLDIISGFKTRAVNWAHELAQKQAQVNLLKSELENKITLEKSLKAQLQAKESQLQGFNAQLQDKDTQLETKDNQLKVQTTQLQATTSQLQAQTTQLQTKDAQMSKMQADWSHNFKLAQQLIDLHQQEEALLNQKSEMTLQQYDLFDRHFTAFEKRMNELLDSNRMKSMDLSGQVEALKSELASQEQDVVALKKQLETSLANQQDQNAMQMQLRDLQSQLQEKENQLNSAQAQGQQLADKEGQLNILQEQLTTQNAQATQNTQNLSAQMAVLKNQLADKENQLDALKDQSDLQSKQQAESLRKQLADQQKAIDVLQEKLDAQNAQATENDQALSSQVQALKVQLTDKEKQLNDLKHQSERQSKEIERDLRKQMAGQQERIDALQQQLDAKNAQAKQSGDILSDYQKKLEAKNSAYNNQLGTILTFRNYQKQMIAQIETMSGRLQDREAQLVKIKKDMYDLQTSMNNKYTDIQTHDLNLSIIQQKALDQKIEAYKNNITTLQSTNKDQADEIKRLKADLALVRQQLKGMPSSDEITFLKTGLADAKAQLKQKDQMLAQAQANADEYAKEFKAQSAEFQSLKVQLQEAYDQLSQKNEDLKYKNLEVVRLKERGAINNTRDLEEQVRVLNEKLAAAQQAAQKPQAAAKVRVIEKIRYVEKERPVERVREVVVKTSDSNKVKALQEQLAHANADIKDLQSKLDDFILSSQKNRLAEKLRQALRKIDEQGRIINMLAEKLKSVGQAVDLSQYKF